MKKPTYPEVRKELLAAFEKMGYTVARRNSRTGGPLKVPHATHPDGTFRLYFKAQSVYAGCPPFYLKTSHSVWSDIKTKDVQSLAQWIHENAERIAKL